MVPGNLDHGQISLSTHLGCNNWSNLEIIQQVGRFRFFFTLSCFLRRKGRKGESETPQQRRTNDWSWLKSGHSLSLFETWTVGGSISSTNWDHNSWISIAWSLIVMSMIYAMSAIYHIIASKMRLGAIWKYAISVFFQKMTTVYILTKYIF